MILLTLIPLLMRAEGNTHASVGEGPDWRDDSLDELCRR